MVVVVLLLELDDDAVFDVAVPPVLLVSNEPSTLSRFNPPEVPEHPQPPLSDDEVVEKGLPSSDFWHDVESSVEEDIVVSAFPSPCRCDKHIDKRNPITVTRAMAVENCHSLLLCVLRETQRLPL